MNLNKLQRIDTLPHLSSYTVDKLITDLSMYKKVLISTKDVIYKASSSDTEPLVVTVSDDVRSLHDLFESNRSVMLPCPNCKDNRPFTRSKGWNPQTVYSTNEPNKKTPLFTGHTSTLDSERHTIKKNVFEPKLDPPTYIWGKNCLSEIHFTEVSNLDQEEYSSLSGKQCKRGILSRAKEFRIDLQCTLDPSHKQIVDFLILPAVTEKPIEMINPRNIQNVIDSSVDYHGKTDDEEKAEQLYYKHCDSLILIKIGQYPALKDLQLFNTQKYRPILKKNYSDYTLALALYSEGIGAGSFVYLRRVLEHLVEEIHQQYLISDNIEEGFNEEEYKKKRFNEKIDYLEKCFSITIIPTEINEFRNSIYGVLSKGIHELSDEECLSVFLYVKYIIDTIIDQRIINKEKEARLAEIKKAFSRLS